MRFRPSQMSCLLPALLLASVAFAAPSKRRQKRSRTPAATQPATPAAAPAPIPTEDAPLAPESSADEPPVPTPAAAASKPSTSKSARASSRGARLKPPRRLVIAGDLFFEDGRLNAEQRINASPREESFDYGSKGFLSGQIFLLFPESERFRWGPGLRFFGKYSASVENQDPYEFGFLTQAFVAGEFALPLAPSWDLLLGGRAGLGLLFPGGNFKQEIDRLQAEGVGVWSLPRVGWLAGLSGGARKQLSDRLALRAELAGQLEQLYLFLTDEDVDGLDFRKSWNTYSLRFGLTVGLEVSF
ncbi:MAG TPA: hypothetical protein VEY30_06760 [Myxococcaceae bacterium]|nr:hypothetical protein [Myxococcaceae bacterium]